MGNAVARVEMERVAPTVEREIRTMRKCFVTLGLVLVVGISAWGQTYVQRGGVVSFEPTGPGVLLGALDPAVKKWYVPQELYVDYGWRQWEYSNYARTPYERYVNTTREGDYFYDVYGNFTTRGWLIYDWRQFQPQPLGSGIFQSTRFNRWFNGVTISGDSQGQYHYAITVGDRIRTTLTPMTFSKPDFNGVQIDFAADKYQATILASRISEPIRGSTQLSGGITEPVTQTNITSLFGGRATFQVGDFIALGAQVMDASNGNTLLDMFNGDLVAGSLTAGQSTAPLTAIAVILSDDSPEDNEGGAALFSHDVRITSRDFDTGKETVSTLQEVVPPRRAVAGPLWRVPGAGLSGGGRPGADHRQLRLQRPGLRRPGPDDDRRGGLQLRVGQRLQGPDVVRSPDGLARRAAPAVDRRGD